MSDFFITLLSDSSGHLFPNNTIAHFKTKLANRICQDGGYEVALSEIIFPMNYHNFYSTDRLEVEIFKQHIDDFDERTITSIALWKMKNGCYRDEHELAAMMSSRLTNRIKIVRRRSILPSENFITTFSFPENSDNYENHSFFSCVDAAGAPQKHLLFTFNRAFERRFGMKHLNDNHYVLERPFDLNECMRLMYIYCDILEYGHVGDIKSPLLRVVAPSGQQGATVSMAFTKPYYLPVAQRDFDTIEIKLTNEIGKLMPFTQGKSALILHFRRKNRLI